MRARWHEEYDLTDDFDDSSEIDTLLEGDDSGLCLIIDGDIIIFQACCVFNDDTDGARARIAKGINQSIDKKMLAAGCSSYIMFVTPKTNFRDHIVDDYKANRADVERPVNLAWAKRWAVDNLNTHFQKFLEADDLLGIYQTDKTVIWSLDKDLRQIAGKHLDDKTDKVIEISELGEVTPYIVVSKKTGKKKTKYHFTGLKGFYFQTLVGDTTDNIVGCAKRLPSTRMGKPCLKRTGIGAKEAYELLARCKTKEQLGNVVGREYYKLHKADWQVHFENQANLLYMVREADGDIIKRWTYDDREEFMDVTTGEIYRDRPNKKDKATT